mmetsp:Transcript_14779/g.30575  ORF Transcript_14779/g.30575 Transcript_14779/m.30575 type:complete len:232 (-) Transcript_14779:268-963(-)
MVDAADPLEGTRHELQKFRVEDAYDSTLGTRSVRHGPQNVETGPHAELLADGGHKAHRWVVDGCHHKGDTDLVDAFDDLGWVEIDLDAQGLQDVGRSAGAANGTISGLGNSATAGRSEDHRGCADVDGVGPVSTRSDNVQEFLAAEINRVAGIVHGLDHTGNLVWGFALLSEECQKRTHLNLVGTLEDLRKGCLGFVSRQRSFTGDQGFDVGFQGCSAAHVEGCCCRFCCC